MEDVWICIDDESNEMYTQHVSNIFSSWCYLHLCCSGMIYWKCT